MPNYFSITVAIHNVFIHKDANYLAKFCNADVRKIDRVFH